MTDPNKDTIKNVEIADVENEGASPELEDADLDKVSGGGHYGGGGYDYS